MLCSFNGIYRLEIKVHKNIFRNKGEVNVPVAPYLSINKMRDG